MKLTHSVVLAGLLAAPLAFAQAPVSVVPAHDSLLPPSIGAWTVSTAAPDSASSSMSIVNANKAALAEDNPQRSQVAVYAGPGGKQLHVEAVQFADYTGAWSAYTLVRKPGLKDAKDLGTVDAVGDNSVLFVSGATLVLAYPVAPGEVKSLLPLVGSLPVVHGASLQAPILPSFLPKDALAPGSVRYAIGPSTYAAQGGVLPANSIGWDKNAEAITASYKDKRGAETLTLLIYPTPNIAREHARSAEAQFAGLGASFTNARVRTELELVMVANGTFSAADAQAMVNGIHMKQITSVDKDVQPSEHQMIGQTASLLQNIAILSGILCTAAVLLGLFLGGGRALVRVLRGKPAAVEIEFLSLHLNNQNAPAIFASSQPPDKQP